MQIEIPQGKGKGHWQRVLVDELGDNPRWGAIVWCPECGRVLYAANHKIDENGQISPSLGHPTEYPPCGWHTNPKLLNWAPVPAAPGPRPFETCTRCSKRSRDVGGWGYHGAHVGIVCDVCFADLLKLTRSTSTRSKIK